MKTLLGKSQASCMITWLETGGKDLDDACGVFLEYLNKIDKGNFGSTWTRKGAQKLKELIHVNRTIEKGVLEELENTEDPEPYFQR